MQGLFYVTCLAFATLGWGYLYYKKDYHPQPLKVIIQIFGIGMMAILPIWAYKYLYQHWVPFLSAYKLFQPVMDKPLLTGLMFFIMNLALLALLLFTLSGILSLGTTFFNRSIFGNLKNALKQEPLAFTAASMILGFIVMIETTIENVTGTALLQSAIGAILALTVIEEYIKHLIVRLIDDKRLKDIDDAITLSVIVGLAFAFIESLIYAYAASDFSLIFYRILISIPIHVVASGIYGYYYGLGHFAEPIVQNTETGVEKVYKKQGVAKWLKYEIVYGEGKIVQGLMYSTLFHAFINVLLEIKLATLAVPVLVFGLMVLSHLYNLSHLQEWMTQFHGLRKKIRHF